MEEKMKMAALAEAYNTEVEKFINVRFNALREEAKRISSEVHDLLHDDKIVVEDEVVEEVEVEEFLNLIITVLAGNVDKNFNLGNINYFLLYRWSKFEELFNAYQAASLSLDKVDVESILLLE